MHAEVLQPISSVPLRWGGFTVQQLVWLGVGASLPYLLLRVQVVPELAILGSLPWLAAALTLAFGRREGRRLDSWVGDWLWFQLQPHQLRHPGTLETGSAEPLYVSIDSQIGPAEPKVLPGARALPWVAPWF